MVGQGAVEIRRLVVEPLSRRRVPRRARCDRAALGLYRAERRLDAELRQCRRACWQRHDGRYLGDGRVLRADRQKLPPFGRGRDRRRARTLAGRAGLIEDDCFIGARSEVVEGVIVEKGAVLAMGTFIGATTKIVNRATGEIHMGRVPSYSVVVPGSLPGKALPDGSPGPSLYCAVIVKQVDAQTRARTSINELLRD